MSEQFYTDTRPEIQQWDTVTIGKAKREWTVVGKSTSGTVWLERQNHNSHRYISRRTISWNDTDTVLTVVYRPGVEAEVAPVEPEAPKMVTVTLPVNIAHALLTAARIERETLRNRLGVEKAVNESPYFDELVEATQRIGDALLEANAN